jgi:endonuclease G, mitochondrial
MTRLILTFLLSLSLSAQAAFDACLDYFPARHVPEIPGRDLCFNDFAVLHSGVTKTPIYVVERLNEDRLLRAMADKSKGKFYPEARLPSAERAQLSDYKGSGYDRGHMAPAGDMPTPEAMAQSFSLANIIPQNAQHNRGTWRKIEQDTRKYVMRAQGDVFVFTGPWYDPAKPAVYAGAVRVPDVIWKAVHDATTGRTWVHWSANEEGERPKAPISYDEFVGLTGLKILAPYKQK